MKRRILVGAAFGAAILVAWLLLRLFPPGRADSFDAAQWKTPNDTECGNEARGEMLEDLKAYHLKRGMTRRQVRVLLGEPDETYGAEEESAAWAYVTGHGLLDCWILTVEFEGGRVAGTSEAEN